MYHMVSSSYYFWLGVGNLQWRERIHARIFRACAVLVGSNVFITQEDAVASFLVVFSLVTFFGLFHFYSRAAQCFAFPAKPYNQSLILKKEKWDARSFKKKRGEREREKSRRCLIESVVLRWCPYGARASPLRHGNAPTTPFIIEFT